MDKFKHNLDFFARAMGKEVYQLNKVQKHLCKMIADNKHVRMIVLSPRRIPYVQQFGRMARPGYRLKNKDTLNFKQFVKRFKR